jgi:hypothetical protein
VCAAPAGSALGPNQPYVVMPQGLAVALDPRAVMFDEQLNQCYPVVSRTSQG